MIKKKEFGWLCHKVIMVCMRLMSEFNRATEKKHESYENSQSSG